MINFAAHRPIVLTQCDMTARDVLDDMFLLAFTRRQQNIHILKKTRLFWNENGGHRWKWRFQVQLWPIFRTVRVRSIKRNKFSGGHLMRTFVCTGATLSSSVGGSRASRPEGPMDLHTERLLTAPMRPIFVANEVRKTTRRVTLWYPRYVGAWCVD